MGVVVTFDPWDIWSGSPGRLPASQTGRVTVSEARQLGQIGRQMACVIPLAVKLTVKGVDDSTITRSRANNTLWLGPRASQQPSFGSGTLRLLH